MNDIKRNKKLYIVATDDANKTPLIFQNGKFVEGTCDKVQPLQVFTKKSARKLIAADAEYRYNGGHAPRSLLMIPLALPSAYYVRPLSRAEQVQRRDNLQLIQKNMPQMYEDMKTRAIEQSKQELDWYFNCATPAKPDSSTVSTEAQ